MISLTILTIMGRTMGDIVLSFYAGLAVMSFVVVILSGNVLIKYGRDIFKHGWSAANEAFYLTIGIFLAWLGTHTIRNWFWNWRFFGEQCPDGHMECLQWMLDSPWLILFIMFLLIGGCIHIRTLTVKRFGEIGWILALSLTTSAIIGNWLYLDYISQ